MYEKSQVGVLGVYTKITIYVYVVACMRLYIVVCIKLPSMCMYNYVYVDYHVCVYLCVLQY